MAYLWIQYGGSLQKASETIGVLTVITNCQSLQEAKSVSVPDHPASIRDGSGTAG